MTHFCDIAIAIDKRSYAEHALLKKVPELLASQPYVEHNNALHWFFESFTNWNEVEQSLLGFFNVLEAMTELPTDIAYTRPDGTKGYFLVERFGCLIDYDDGHTENLGDPEHYGLSEIRYLDCPARDAMLEKEGIT